MKNTLCPACETGLLSEVTYSDRIRFGRSSVLVNGLLKSVCGFCEDETVSEEQFSANRELANLAISKVGCAVTPGMLQTFRKHYGLTQKDASQLFGAGSSSFAKWESSQSSISAPSALLLQCAFKFPQVVDYLAELQRLPLDENEVGEEPPVIEAKLYAATFDTIPGPDHASRFIAAQNRRIIDQSRRPTSMPQWVLLA